MTSAPQSPDPSPNPSSSQSPDPGFEAQERSTVWFGGPVEQQAGTGQPVDVQDAPTGAFLPAPATPAPTTFGTTAGTTATAVGARWPAGPNPAAILLGLLCLAVAAVTISREVSGVVVHLAMIGPAVILVAGLVFVLTGLSGLLRRR